LNRIQVTDHEIYLMPYNHDMKNNREYGYKFHALQKSKIITSFTLHSPYLKEKSLINKVDERLVVHNQSGHEESDNSLTYFFANKKDPLQILLADIFLFRLILLSCLSKEMCIKW
jgi:hypothetical protein